ncbi:ABC transporter substrate-binding protein, partial [Pseudomonas sp. BGM005]|nr:ABC transporter substrate-binding protein [Pseudomonas sp. BG5]
MKNFENSISASLRRRLLAGAAAAAALLVFSTGTASAAANCIKGDRKAPYTIGW